MTDDETCPQCLKSLTGYASRLVQDSCGHRKCRRCLLLDENGCKTCENAKQIENNRLSILEQQLNKTPNPEIKQNTNVIRFYQNETNFQHVSVVKSPNTILQTKIGIENQPTSVKVSENCTKNKIVSTKKRKEVKNLDKKVQNKPKCDECGQEFRRRSHLEWHMRRHTGERPFVCEICKKSYTQKAKLNRHSKLHTDERPFGCELCDKTFRSKTSLISHSRIHSGEKPYSCIQCSAKFTELSNLNKHLTVHTKEKPFMCADCGARFSLKWRLTVHLRVHSRERPFSCTQCQRAFNNLKDLRRHEITHSSDKPFVCTHCLTHFRRKDNLERHIKNTHYDSANGKLKKEVKLKEKTEEKAENCLNDKSDNCLASEHIVDSVIKSGSNYLNIEQTDVRESKSEPLKGNAVSVILGPPKLACKKKEFKDKFELGRQDPELDHNVYIYQRILSPITDRSRDDEQNPRRNVDTIIKTLNKNPIDIIKQHQMTPLSVPRIHYETSFESGPHATIKNIKFKLPADYTSKISKLQNTDQQAENEIDTDKEYTQLTPVMPIADIPPMIDKQNCVRTITKTPVISNNVDVENQQLSDNLGKHWRKRSTHIYGPD